MPTGGGSVKLRFEPGWWRKAEIAARDDRLAPAVTFELLGLALLRTGVDRFGRQQASQLRLALRAEPRMGGILGEVARLLRIMREVEQLRGVFDVVDVLEAAMAKRERSGGRPHAVILAQDRPVGPLAIGKPIERDAGMV